MDISNEQFLETIFGDQYPFCHVTSFTQDPGNIPPGESGRCWAGGYFHSVRLKPNSNQYYTVSLFKEPNRRKANFKACYVIGLDDVKEKLPIEQVMKLPPPSIIMQSSLYSEQWLYLLQEPCNEASKVDNLHDGLIANGLAPDSKDPGQKSVSRFLRLPESCNTKAKRIKENNGIAPRCEVTEWHPERRYTLEQLASPFSVDINAPRDDKRVDGAAAIEDHPLLKTPAIHIKETRSDGRFDIRCPWIDEHTGADDSGAAIFTNDDGTIGFKCHHGACDHRTGKDLLDYIEQEDAGFKERLKYWQIMRDLGKVAGDAPMKQATTLISGGSPLARLQSMVADGAEMLKQMADDKFILKDLAIAGHWSVFFAGPNTGKTLLTQWLLHEAISTGEIDGKDVFYINVDDTARGGAEKEIMAREFGYQMILNTSKGFRTKDVLGLIEEMTDTGEANGKVLILDTLKAFTDLMDKKMSSDFGNIARNFVAAGGTLICLAHVNKHKGVDGKSIYAGTSDIRDQSDCVYIIEDLGSVNSGLCKETHTVQFVCSKSRGDVSQSVTFQYIKEKGAGYRAMFDSVVRHEGNAAKEARNAAKEAGNQQADSEVVESIRAAMTNHVRTQGDIVKFVMDTSDIPKHRIRQVLNKYSGQLWNCDKGFHNTFDYSMIEPPMPPVESVSFL